MNQKKALTQEICSRYRKAGRKEKKAILDEFIQTTRYNRKYAIRLLGAFGTTRVLTLGGKNVKLKVAKPKKPGNRTGKPVYTQDTVDRLRTIWAFFWYKCGKYLAPMIRENMPFLEASGDPDFHLTPETKRQLLAISPAQIDRLLKPERDRLRVRGISGTRLAEASLLKQIPIRTHYTETERNTPGFCQMDTVHHCGDSDSGEFNLTLTVTEVSSGWTFLFPLLNKAHRWTIEYLKHLFETSPFKIIELHSDNGSEFINHSLLNWQKLVKTLNLTRSRSHHKNDNCYAEQKNNAFVRNYVGYSRFDTDRELAALGKVYTSLCPLVNFFIPNKKLLSKTTVGSKTAKVYDKPKTPYLRLLESSISQEEKDTLAALRSLYNPVELQHSVHKAVNALLTAHKAKVTFPK
jgi:transposase InsO family protein